MSTALTPQQHAIARAERTKYLSQQYGLTEPQVDVMRNAICVGATDPELEFFLATARRLDLDPFARQIWFVKRKQKRQNERGDDEWIDVGRPETGIDGYRAIAERSGEMDGQDPTVWIDNVGKEYLVWLDEKPPHACRITLYRKGRKTPIVAVGLFREYCPVYKTKTGSYVPEMWAKRGVAQIEKCVEALAFRKGFPGLFAGVRIDAEMEHVDAAASSAVAAFSAPPLPPQQGESATAKIGELARDAEIAREVAKPAAPDVAQLSRVMPERPSERVDAPIDSAEPRTEPRVPAPDALTEEQQADLAGLRTMMAKAVSRDDLKKVGDAVSIAKKRLAKQPEIADAMDRAIASLDGELRALWIKLMPQPTRGR